MTDPWMVHNSGQQNNTVENGRKDNGVQQNISEEDTKQTLEFEDSFAPIPPIEAQSTFSKESSPKTKRNNSTTGSLEPLPDSDNYLRGLERKLQRIKKGANLVEALAEKRNDCLRQLLYSGDPDNNNAELALDEPLNNLEFCRHLQPVQALSVGELVHIVKYDQLQPEDHQDSVDKQQEIETDNKKEKTQD